MTTCAICGKVWTASPNDPVPCLAIVDRRSLLDPPEGHVIKRPATEIAACSGFTAACEGPIDLVHLERLVPGLTNAAAGLVLARAMNVAGNRCMLP